MLVHTLSVRSFDPAFFELDGTADDRLGEQTAEHKRQHCTDCTRQHTARYQTLLHGCGSVAGEAEQMPCVVEELVHVGVAAE